MIINIDNGCFQYHQYLFLMIAIVAALLLGVAVSFEICSSEEYDSYLSSFPLKCGNDCDEYKRWV